MKLIVGLGNPGERYKWTRHNIGFKILNAFQKERYSQTGIGIKEGKLSDIYVDDRVTLVWPKTFMNKSGGSLVKSVKFHNFDLNDVYVIHDDLDIPLGKFKIQKGRGPKVHNGLQSIYGRIGKYFWHVRVGIDNRQGKDKKIPGEKYVLQKFRNDEEKIILETVDRVVVRLVAEIET